MSALSIQPTYPIFTDIDGQPLEAGYVWIGTENLDPQTNPINVYWDAALTILAPQPIRTLAGYPSRNGTPARLYVNSDYSIRVMNRNGSAVYSAPSATERYSGVVVSVNAEDVVYDPPFTAAVQTNVEAKLALTVNVRDFGAVGDGVTDDTAAIQAAVDAVIAEGGGTVNFPTGTFIVTSVDVQHGIILQGSGATTIKRPANTPNWTRTFTTQNNLWSQSYDSQPLMFKDLYFDGNRDNQGAYSAYQLEQAHLIFVVGDANFAGRLRVVVEGCTFVNCVADAISVYVNVDIAVDDCFFSNCFRGALVVTGGYTKVRADNIVIRGTVNSRGIDYEVDGAGFGGTHYTQGTLSNIETNACFDVSFPNQSRVTITNITYGDISEQATFNVQTVGATNLNISNSSFALIGGAHLRQIRFSEDVRIDNCSFTYFNAVNTGSTVSLVVYAEAFRNVLINNCRFGIATGSATGDTFYALEFTAGNSNDHKAKISDCYFDIDFDAAVACVQGGYISLSNCFFNSQTGLVFGGSGSFPFYGEMMDCTVGFYNTHLWNQQSNNTGTSLYVSGGIEAADYSTTGIGGTSWYYKSDLTVFGADADPNTAPVFGNPNDTYKQKGFPIYGSAGTPVLHVGSAVAGPPYFTWVPVDRA